MTASSGCDRVRRAIKTALADGPNVDLTWLAAVENDWSMAHDTLRFVFSLVEQLQPQHVLEFGGGTSTHVLARATASASPDCRISSVDHDPEFQRLLAAEMARGTCASRVIVQLAPIVAREWAGQWLPTYHVRTEALASHRPPDLILIDGPPIALGGREAIREFEEERSAGARVMAFGWPAFWWFDTYRGLYEVLRSRHRCVLSNQRLVVFELASPD